MDGGWGKTHQDSRLHDKSTWCGFKALCSFTGHAAEYLTTTEWASLASPGHQWQDGCIGIIHCGRWAM